MVVAMLAVAALKRWWVLFAFWFQGVAWMLGWHAALDRRWPCWWASNAAWCGHLCDADPGDCREWKRGPCVYGGNESCKEP